MKRRLVEKEEVVVARQHHVSEQLGVLNALAVLPGLVISLAINPPSLPEPDSVLVVEL